MLLEWLRHAITPCPDAPRRLGCLRESIAIEARHGRLRRAWAPHLEACRRLVRESADLCVGSGTALILGSGSLLDIPLEELADRFDRVILADVLHLPGARRRAGRLANVECVSADVTAALSMVLEAWRAKDGRALEVPAPALFRDSEPDLVVSANLLSQLPILPLERLADFYEEEELLAFARGLVEAHLEWLAGFSGVVCLMTDVARRLVASRGGREDVIEEEDALYGVELDLPGRLWEWNIAPSPEIARGADWRHLVLGVADLRAARVRSTSE